MGCGPVGGPPTFDPFMQATPFGAPAPYYAPQPQPRPVAVQPKPKPRPAPVAVLPPAPRPEPVAVRPVEVPPPEQLGIMLTEPAVVVPEPAALGIGLE